MSLIGKKVDDFKVQAAQFVAVHGDQVCPARWRPGSKTLKPSLELVGTL